MASQFWLSADITQIYSNSLNIGLKQSSWLLFPHSKEISFKIVDVYHSGFMSFRILFIVRYSKGQTLLEV
jgi:hypothetical protein